MATNDELRAEMEAVGWTVEALGAARDRVLRATSRRDGQKIAVALRSVARADGEGTPLARAYRQLHAAVLLEAGR